MLGWAGSPKVLRVRKNIGLGLNPNFSLGFKPITKKARVPDSAGLGPMSVDSDPGFLAVGPVSNHGLDLGPAQGFDHLISTPPSVTPSSAVRI